MENTNLITLENAGLRYGKGPEVLKDINFTLNTGDFVFLIGDSGSGKSSFLNLISSSLRATRGYISVLGYNLDQVNKYQLALMRRRIGVIFQDFKLLQHLSVEENIALPLKIASVAEEDINKRIQEMLHWIELKDYRYYQPLMLSGGQQQRVAIARAVINKPSIILADEPTGSIDAKMANKILNMLEELNKQGVAIIFATHNIELLQNNKHNVATLQNGKLQLIERKKKNDKNS